MEPCGGGAFRKAEVSFFTVQVDRTDVGQVFTAGVQIVFVLDEREMKLLSKVRISKENPNPHQSFTPI